MAQVRKKSKPAAKRKAAPKKKSSAKAPPAYILSLSLKNVRCFGPEQTLDLCREDGRPARWTVILGDNGTGKTTLLQSLATAARPPSFSEAVFRGAEFSQGFLFFDSSIYRRVGNEALVSITVATGALLAAEQRGGVTGMSLSGTQDSDGCTRISYTPPRSGIDGLKCFGYGASRQMGSVSLAKEDEGDATASLFFDDVPLRNAQGWLLQSDYTAAKSARGVRKQKAEKRRAQVEAALVELLPDVDELRITTPSSRKEGPRVEFHTHYGWVRLESLSLGYRSMIAWVVDFAARMFERYPDRPDPLAEPAVVLVDEIDLHLHPKWQRTIMDYLTKRFKETQFIVTAHSPLVVQAATNANIVLLQREGDHVVIENDVKTIQGWRIDQVLTSDLFGLKSARPPGLDGFLEERAKILSKSRLTKKDEARLKKLEAEMGELPTGDTPEDIEAMDIIRRAATDLKRKKA